MKITALAAGLVLAGSIAGITRTVASESPSDLDHLMWGKSGVTRRADAHGGSVSGDTLKDRLAVVSFVSAGCTILCVTRTMDLDKLARDLPEPLRGRVVFLAVDTDPAADDAKGLRAFSDGLLGPAPRLRVLPSDAEATRTVVEMLHYPAASLPEPPPTVLLFDRRGKIAMTYGGDPLDAPRLQRDIAVLDTFTEGLDGPAPTASADARPPL